MSAPVIDFHIHPVCYDRYCSSTEEWIILQQSAADWQGIIKKYEVPEEFSRYLAENGVDYGVIMADMSPIASGICTNLYVLEFCRSQKRLIPFANVNPYMTERGAAGPEARRLLQAGFRGFKVYPSYQYFYPNDRMLYPLYAAAEEAGAPIMVHTGSSVFKGARIKYADPLFLDDVAVDFPRLKVLLVHSGRVIWYNTAFYLARLHENVYMEVAGLPPQKLMDYFPELERNADKIIFGSDWPGVVSIKDNIDVIRNLPLKEETREKILGGNAARILGIQQ
jgi:predicted TIM-barrel fold metal-dependent hydrolase